VVLVSVISINDAFAETLLLPTKQQISNENDYVLTKADCFSYYSIPLGTLKGEFSVFPPKNMNPMIPFTPVTYPPGIPVVGETVPNHCLTETLLGEKLLAEMKKLGSGFQTYVLSFKHGQFYIPYKITDGNLNRINPSGHGSLEVYLETFKDGFLIISMPRKFLDTPEQLKFIVLDTRERAFIELNYEENSTETNRILTIPISTDTEKIEILYRGWDVPKFTYEKSDYDYLFSPMKQIKNGVFGNIMCKQELELMIKISNKNPVCVTHSSAERLIERGWGDSVFSLLSEMQNSMKSINGTNTEFSIEYSINGGEVLNTNFDDYGDITLSLITTRDGEMNIKIPRLVVGGSCVGGDDLQFIVLSDGEEISSETVVFPMERSLTFKFTNGTKQIEILASAMCLGMPSGGSPFLK
jgi:hypothetical protein